MKKPTFGSAFLWVFVFAFVHCQTKALALKTVSISIPYGGPADWFRLYGDPLLKAKVGKTRVPASGPSLRYGYPRYTLAPAGARRRAVPGPTALAGHPWPSPHYARVPLGLLKGRLMAPGISRAQKQEQKQSEARVRLCDFAFAFVFVFVFVFAVRTSPVQTTRFVPSGG
ncbi:hypothetical protein ACIQUS_05180 [Pseudomonas sp. NPDC090755]|uniref:hypothetical protein n=1 Tax=Pseudomonas sp. NPDC090755 TaxID=3364481 RepID=UPI00383B1CA6